MTQTIRINSLDIQCNNIKKDLSASQLITESLQNHEACLSSYGALVSRTGQFTGRSPKDRFLVKDSLSEHSVDWGKVNQAMGETEFDNLLADVLVYLQDKNLYLKSLKVGHSDEYAIPVSVVSEYAWHGLFVHNMFLRNQDNCTASPFTIINVPGFKVDNNRHGGNSDTLIAVNLSKRIVLICNTQYAGEMKKSMFSIMNYYLTDLGILPMHCSANVHKENGDVALFFGLSGTGKTTLSAESKSTLVGDDEHGWGNNTVFNFEGGCYAKTINLSAEQEPEIYKASNQFGTVLENVVLDAHTSEPDYNDTSLTENTRSAYPLHALDNVTAEGKADIPKNVFFLVADAFGVLPPVAKLSPEAAMYHFMSGYTAKVAGTERGITEPTATFSTCFGSPFLPRQAIVYAELLKQKMQESGASVWLINTGWHAGGATEGGSRYPIKTTRGIINAVRSGAMDDTDYTTLAPFNLAIPTRCKGLDADIFNPENAWQDKQAYQNAAAKLTELFKDNFKKFHSQVSDAIITSGPQ